MKKTGLKCRAKAYVSVKVFQPESEGGQAPPPVYTLERIHTPEWHNHVPDNTRNIARCIIGKMRDKVTENPCAKIGMFFSFFSPLTWAVTWNYCRVYG